MVNEYDKMLSDYRNGKINIDSLRIFILSNITYLANENCASKLREVAIFLDDKVGEAFSYCIEFWFYNVIDLDYAHEQNQIGGSIFETIPNYEDEPLYLTYLNNELIYLNSVGGVKDAFYLASRAMKIAKRINKITYFIAFAHNFSYTLQELGLYEDAYNRVRETFDYESYQQPLTRIAGRNMMISNLFLLNRLDETKKYIDEIIKINHEFKMFDDAFFANYYLDYYLKINDTLNIEKYKEIVLSFPFEETDTDINRVYLALGRYYLYKENYENSSKYFELAYSLIDKYVGCKRTVIKEIYEMYHHFNQKDLYEKYLEIYTNKSDEIIKILSEIIYKNDVEINSNDNVFTYKKLYKESDIANNFINRINSLINLNDLYHAIKAFINEICPNLKFEFLVHKKRKYFSIKNNETIEVPKFNINIFSNEMFNLDDNTKALFDFKIDKGYALIYKNRVQGYFLFDSKGFNQKKDFSRGLEKRCLDSCAIVIKNSLHYQELLAIAHTDHLTKMLNREGLYKEIKDNKYDELKYYVVMLDIDDFKVTNDTYGHPAGDIILEQIGKRLIKIFGFNYTSRMGGEEFAILFNKSKENLIKKLDQFFKSINEMIVTFDKYEIKTGISAGISSAVTLKNFNKGYKEADSILYEVKRTKKGIYKFY